MVKTPLCHFCERSTTLDPLSISSEGDIKFQYRCDMHGIIKVKQLLLVKLNWEELFVNRKFHTTLQEYAIFISRCMTQCIGCTWKNKCYGNFFHDIDKDLLRQEIKEIYNEGDI
jgi:hypothetical protein